MRGLAGVALWVLVVGCAPPSEDEEILGVHEITEHGMLTRDQWRAETEHSGLLVVPIEVEEGDTSLSVDVSLAYTHALDPYVTELIDPDGNTVLSTDDWAVLPRKLTDALAPSNAASSLTWPILALDPPLEPGTWTTVWDIASADRAEVVDVAVHTKADPDLDRGTLTVHLALATGLDTDPEVGAALEEAVGVAASIYAAAGVELQVMIHAVDLDPGEDLIASPEAARIHRELAAPGELVIALSPRPVGLEEFRGVTSSTPGCLIATDYSVMQLMLDNHREDYDPSKPIDADLLGSSIAHEVGHYLGLHHPFEKDYATWDALSDTPECGDYATCIEDFFDNLMYPGRVCEAPGDCYLPTELTRQQIGVVQRAMAVL